MVTVKLAFLSPDAASATAAQTKLLLIIQGGYRTLDLTLDSILRNLCHANGGCDVALSLANPPDVVSAEARLKLAPYLVAAYYAEPHDLRHPHYIFEYEQTLKVLTRLPLEPYTHVMRVRADCYVSVPMPLLSALGAGRDFARHWREFGVHLPDSMAASSKARLTAWLFTGAVPQLVPKLVLQQAPPMAWSPMNSVAFNEQLVRSLAALGPLPAPEDAAGMQRVVQRLVREHHLLYISGGLFLHCGATADLVSVTQQAFEHWRHGPGVTLNWADEFPAHAGAREWRQPIAQEANVRLAHRHLRYALIDLHNVADYLVSFSWKHYDYSALTRARGLVIWLLRPRQVRFKHVLRLNATRFWDALDDMDFPNAAATGKRALIHTHGCLSDSTPEELDECFQEERDQ